ncbi:ATP-binding protein [Streptomyces sp. NPDC001380]|uniref:ATP-binding protein n=1 Tax=Streptomyces sp. NPDC001380 TaxID=3364566 RepID=UPI0036876690
MTPESAVERPRATLRPTPVLPAGCGRRVHVPEAFSAHETPGVVEQQEPCRAARQDSVPTSAGVGFASAFIGREEPMRVMTQRPGTVRALAWRMDFSFYPASVPLVRAQVRRTVADWGFAPELVDDVELVATELAANAVLHGRVPGWELFTVRLVPGPHGLTVEVSDGSPRMPVPVRGGEDDEGGRGLHLVEALSKRWGVARRSGSGKCTWALLAVRLPAYLYAAHRAARPAEVHAC